jgi:hypothetical protein
LDGIEEEELLDAVETFNLGNDADVLSNGPVRQA